MTERVLPDFKFTADLVTDKAELPELLKDIYEKGYYAGYYDGRLAESIEWYTHQDEAMNGKEGSKKA